LGERLIIGQHGDHEIRETEGMVVDKSQRPRQNAAMRADAEVDFVFFSYDWRAVKNLQGQPS
jgi:hypothetical protein